MRLTLIHPTIGRKTGHKYIRSWQMEPLPPAMIAGLTPKDVDIRFHDDRMEPIPYDQPTDLVAMSVETYTAKRAYQIASEYRARGVPVVMGGFHASLCPEEVAQHAEAVVVGEAENTWNDVLFDAERGTLKTYYHAAQRPVLGRVIPNRSIYRGKRYLPLGLLEASRGCCFKCEFCAIQSVFHQSQSWRPIDTILAELEQIRKKPLIFFVDDNIGADLARAKEFFKALIPLKIRWVSQMSIQAAYDEELLRLMSASGCQGVLIGFESLNPENLEHMQKSFNTQGGSFDKALANLRKYHIKLYITFVFGYDNDNPDSFAETVAFARKHQFFMAAFNHLTPFPGTPLYSRLAREGRLLFDRWWLDDQYRYNMIPFRPAQMSAGQLRQGCLESREQFYAWRSIWHRGFDQVNSRNYKMWLAYFWINALVRKEVTQRDFFPLGDEGWGKKLLKIRSEPPRLKLVPAPVEEGV